MDKNNTSNSKNIKLPPQNIEAEQSVLGSLMLDKEAITRIADILTAKDFYRGSHHNIYQAMLDLYEKNEPIDLLSLANRLQEKKQLKDVGGNSYLTTLLNSVPTSAHVVYYAKIIKSKKTLRDLIDASYQVTELCYQESDDVEKLVDRAEQKIFDISQSSIERKFISLKEGLAEAFERIEKLHQGDGATRGVPTGFLDLDKYLGGFQKSDLLILASRPSVGKTTLGLDFARNVAYKQKIPVAIFSIEMAKEQLVDRLLSSQSQVDLWKMRSGYLSTEGPENDFQKIQSGLGELSDTPIFIDDTPSPTIMQMRTIARRLHTEHNLGLIMVDYLQMIQPRNNNESPVQQMTEISRGLKSLARELNVPVLALSQLSRAVESRTPAIPKLSDLRDSGCLTGDSKLISAKTGKRISIKKLAQRKKQNPIQVLAVDKNYKLKPHWLTKAFYSGQKTIYKLKTNSGRIIKASSNHPFLKLEGWSRLDRLKPGDSIALPRHITIKSPANPLSDNELILLARNKFHPITKWYQQLGIKRVRSWQKQLPEKIFRCNNKKIALFLKHLWATDGNLSQKKIKNRKPSASIYYATSSKKLSRQIQHLLLRIGINSSLRKATPKQNYRNMYHLSIEGTDNQLKFLQFVGIADRRKKTATKIAKQFKKIKNNPNTDIIPKEAWDFLIKPVKEKLNISWRLFAQQMEIAYNGSALFNTGISRERMNRIAKILPQQNLSNLANSDLFWDKIKSIKKIKTEEVYDATVEKAHNFIANDIIVHNSIEQDADVVLFIYREDKDKNNSERPNIAEVIIAKHRNGPIGKTELFFNENQVSFKNLEKRYE